MFLIQMNLITSEYLNNFYDIKLLEVPETDINLDTIGSIFKEVQIIILLI